MSHLNAPRKLSNSDQRAEFNSGADELDDWLRKYAMQNQRANNATTYVITEDDRVVGYYAIAIAPVAREDAPPTVSKSSPTQIPCLLLARLAVDIAYANKQIGWELLRDALIRAVHLSESIRAAAVLIHCRDERAKQFYLHNGDF